MNEPWSRVVSEIREVDGKRYRSTLAVDRLGFRQIFNGVVPIEDFGYEGGALDCPTKHLVLLEDCDDDAYLFELGARKSGLAIKTHRASSLGQARELLAGNRPSLVTLDCQLPGESGLDLLREIRSLETYRPVPVVMMSGSESDEDVRAAYANGANSFLRKPFDCQEYVRSVSKLLQYWLEMNYAAIAPASTPSCVWLG